MRKLFLAGVSVLALGVSGAMAQEAIVNQTGTNGLVDVDQTLATGADMDVFIDQAGDENEQCRSGWQWRWPDRHRPDR